MSLYIEFPKHNDSLLANKTNTVVLVLVKKKSYIPFLLEAAALTINFPLFIHSRHGRKKLLGDTASHSQAVRVVLPPWGKIRNCISNLHLLILADSAGRPSIIHINTGAAGHIKSDFLLFHDALKNIGFSFYPRSLWVCLKSPFMLLFVVYFHVKSTLHSPGVYWFIIKSTWCHLPLFLLNRTIEPKLQNRYNIKIFDNQ